MTPSPPAWSNRPPLDWPDYGAGFGTAIARAYRKYATFSGRASRAEYWWFALFVVMVFFGLALLAGVTTSGEDYPGPYGYLLVVFWLGSVVPSISLTVRRLHDTGRSGVYYLCGFIPLVGGIIMSVLLARATSPAAARFGPPYPRVNPPHPYTVGPAIVHGRSSATKPAQRGRWTPVIVVSIVIVVLATLAGGVVINTWIKNAATNGPSGVYTDGTSAGASEPADQSTTMPESTDPEPSTESTETGEPTVSANPEQQLPYDATVCSRDDYGRPLMSTAIGNDHTTCPFAQNVVTAYNEAGGTGQSLTVKAHSPVTKKNYRMSCSMYAEGVAQCAGGVDAVVYLF